MDGTSAFFLTGTGAKHPTNVVAFITAAGNLQRGRYKEALTKMENQNKA
jgi:hypothetical protein